mgnify:CR=1 FL=1|nr:MAG TPA: ASCH domain protein [Caudoviricetes sp.]
MKPILFNTAMVQAILDGRKTTTRRIIKDNQCFQGQLERRRISPDEFLKSGFCKNNWDDNTKVEQNFRRPYNIGDILYIRETWFEGDILDSNEDIAERNIVLYRTDDLEKHDIEEIKWRPSIHMPKRLARIFLKVTGVRVERLKRIEAGQCKAEGIDLGYKIENSFDAGEYCKAFGELWDSTVNKKDIDKYSWNANPYVWVIEFERCEKPND